MQVIHGRLANSESRTPTETFVGRVLQDPVLRGEGIMVNNVFFEPCAHTYWHHHERGQLLVVTMGLGFVATRDGERAAVKAGDMIYTPPGQEHCHGAGPHTFMHHIAISMGETAWHEKVSPETYDEICGLLETGAQ